MASTPMTLDHALDDICCRFVANLPSSEKKSTNRLCFQLEMAHWFYEDHLRASSASEQLDISTAVYQSHTTSFPQLRFPNFCRQMLARVDDLSRLVPKVPQMLESYSAYKRSIPVAGVILLNSGFTKCLMVRGHKKRDTWTFPKGKINQGESLLDCAVRELHEETGYACEIHPDTPFLEWTDWNGRNTRLYILKGISEDTAFGCQTKNEIWDIAWHTIQDALSDRTVLRKRYTLASAPLELLANWISDNKHLSQLQDPLVLPIFNWDASIRKALNILWAR